MKIIFAEKIDEFIESHKISKLKFCKLAKISYNTLLKIYKQDTSINLKVFYNGKLRENFTYLVCDMLSNFTVVKNINKK